MAVGATSSEEGMRQKEGPPGNLLYDLPVTLKVGKKERQDWF
jgi:hypothetical protein